MHVTPLPEVARPRRLVVSCQQTQELIHVHERHLSNYFRFRRSPRRRSNSRLLSPYVMPKIRRHWSGEMHLTPLPEVARPRRPVECVGNEQQSLIYNSDICRTTSVSGVGDQTPDSYIAVYNAKNTTSFLVRGNASHAATGSRPTTTTGGMYMRSSYFSWQHIPPVVAVGRLPVAA